MSSNDLLKVKLVLTDKSEVVCRDVRQETVADSPTWNRYRALLQEWKMKQEPTNELIELLIEFLPIDIELLLWEKYDGGDSDGYQRAVDRFSHELPCENGLMEFRDELVRLYSDADLADRSIEDLEEMLLEMKEYKNITVSLICDKIKRAVESAVSYTHLRAHET